VPFLTRSAVAEAELIRALYDEDAPVMRRYAFRLTGNRTRTETWCGRCYYGRGSIRRLTAAPRARHGPGRSPSPAT
jgi:hypothetical protein